MKVIKVGGTKEMVEVSAQPSLFLFFLSEKRFLIDNDEEDEEGKG